MGLKKYGNINVQSYDKNNVVFGKLYPFNRLTKIEYKACEPLLSEYDSYKINNINYIVPIITIV